MLVAAALVVRVVLPVVHAALVAAVVVPALILQGSSCWPPAAVGQVSENLRAVPGYGPFVAWLALLIPEH